ncbi:MAG: DUF4136 domain-containing protein [Rufibacter sp.]
MIGNINMTLLGWVLLVTMACSAVKISKKEAAPGFSLQNYKTFGFYNENRAANEQYSQYVQLLQQEISQQLQSKGLTPSSSQPDLLVNLGLMVTDKTQTRTTHFGQDGPYYTGQRRYTWRSQEIPVNTYQEGNVSVHLVDQKQNELVWQAEVSAVIPNKQEKVKERIKEGIQAMFQEVN